MTTTIENLHQELVELKKDMAYVKSLISEDFELSEHAKNALKEARETTDTEYVDLE